MKKPLVHVAGVILIIYPYWILNVVSFFAAACRAALIIYPYWILNEKHRTRQAVWADAYNLSILDFKFINKHFPFAGFKPYNLSILDFKCKTPLGLFENIYTYNLSILDFKFVK